MSEPTTPDYRGFVRAIMDGWPEPNGESMDGFELQDLAEKHGVLVPETRTTFCADPFDDEAGSCQCSEYHEPGETFTCYRLHPDMRECEPKP